MPGSLTPADWPMVPLGEATTWISGGTPSTARAAYWRGEIPWVSPKDMKRFRIEDAQDHLTAAAVAAGSRVAPAGSVLVVVRGMILARTFPVCLTTRELAFNQDVKAVIPSDAVDGTFLAHWFLGNSEKLLRLATQATHGTRRIALSDLQTFPLATPPLPEQRRVAEILDAVDEAISGADQTIAKLKQTRHGLIHDLLTRGLPENGSAARAGIDGKRCRFAEGPLGALLRPVREPGAKGLPLAAVTLTDGLVLRDPEERRVETALSPEQHLLVRKGDIAYNMMRMWQGACGLAEADCLVSPAYVVLRMNQRLSPRFAYRLFKSPQLIAAFLTHSRGLTSDRFRLYPRDLLRIRASIPVDVHVQQRIADVVDHVEQRIESESAVASKLRTLKRGLMDDLLTGRVRIPIPEAATP